MINEKELIAKLEKMAEESREESGLKEPALLQRIIKEVKDMAVNEEIRQRIEREDASDNRWIPVSECLPKEGDYVLFSFSNESTPHVGEYKNEEAGQFFYPDDDKNSYEDYGLIVNAWMPLPEPYRGETE